MGFSGKPFSFQKTTRISMVDFFARCIFHHIRPSSTDPKGAEKDAIGQSGLGITTQGEMNTLIQKVVRCMIYWVVVSNIF